MNSAEPASRADSLTVPLGVMRPIGFARTRGRDTLREPKLPSGPAAMSGGLTVNVRQRKFGDLAGRA